MKPEWFNRNVMVEVLRAFSRNFLLAILGIGGMCMVQALILKWTPGWRPENPLPELRISNCFATENSIDLTYSSLDEPITRAAVIDCASTCIARTIPINAAICSRSSSNGRHIAIADIFGAVYLVDSVNLDQPKHFAETSNVICGLDWCQDNSKLLIRTMGSVQIWSIEQRAKLQELPLDLHTESLLPLHDNQLAIVSSHSIRAYDTATGLVEKEIRIPPNSKSPCVTSDLKTIAYLNHGHICVASTVTGELLLHTPAAMNMLTGNSIAISRDGKYLASIGSDDLAYRLRIHVISEKKIFSECLIDSGSIGGIQFIDSNSLLVWSFSGSICRFDLSPTEQDHLKAERSEVQYRFESGFRP